MQPIYSRLQKFIIETVGFQKSISLVLILFLSFEASTQDQIYENFGVDDGLPSSEVYDTYQDKEGYLWFATDKGLSRYNGYEFENFDTSDGLTGNVVLRFYPQANGQVWCYTFHSKSLFYFDEKFSGFKQFKYNDVLHEVLQSQSIVKSVYVDDEENVHIGGHLINGQIIISKNGDVIEKHVTEDYFQDTIRKMVVIKPIPDSVRSPSVFTTIDSMDFNSNVFHNEHISSRLQVKWLVQNEIAIFMNYTHVTLVFKNGEKTVIKTGHAPTGVQVINEDSFFIGYEFGGGKICDRNGSILKEYLKDQSLTSFLKDHEGGYWLTSLNAGIFYLKSPSISVYNSNNTKSQEINSIVKTKESELLIGHINGTISRISKNRDLRVSVNPKTTTHAFVEFDSLLDKTYIFNEDILKVNQESETLNQYLLKLSEPNNKTLFAAYAGGFYTITEHEDVSQYLCPHRVHDVVLRNNDTLIATPVGIFKFQNEDCHPLSNQSSLFNYRSDDIDVNNNNILYVATHGAGVVIDDGKFIFNITEKDGLNSNIVNEVHIENDSTLWACTNRGINRIIWAKQGLIINSMSKKDGLLSNEVNDIEIINDTVWVGTKQGLCRFPKDQMSSKIIDVPYLKLNDVMVNNVSQGALSPVNLSHKENEISFLLEGISYADKENLYYQYRLNKNHNWSSTQNREIHFSSLTPANYTFEVKACIDDEICSEKTIVYSFTIEEPFWRKWWFRSLCLFIIGLLIYSFFKIRVLTYNKDITREFIRLMIRRLKTHEKYFTFREDGKDIRLKTYEISYVKSAGNYIDVHTENKKHTIRMNIGKFLDNVPDRLEYVRVHRSYIVRIDKITSKSKHQVELVNGPKIPVSLNHHKKLKEVVF